MPGLPELLDAALATGDDAKLRKAVRSDGDRAAFAELVAEVVIRQSPPIGALEALLDGWVAQTDEVVLACAAVAAYAEVGLVRPDWRDDELSKLRRAATDPRPEVRDAAAKALDRLAHPPNSGR
jgi:hypothetical protein